MTETDKNIHFLVSKVRDLEENKSTLTFNGVEIQYVDDSTLDEYRTQESMQPCPTSNYIKNSHKLAEELKNRKNRGVAVVNKERYDVMVALLFLFADENNWTATRHFIGCKEDVALAFPKIPEYIKDPWIMAREALGVNNNLWRKRGEKP